MNDDEDHGEGVRKKGGKEDRSRRGVHIFSPSRFAICAKKERREMGKKVRGTMEAKEQGTEGKNECIIITITRSEVNVL